MTEQEKQLLLVDLCSRLPHGVSIETKDGMQGELISVVPSLDEVQFKPFDCKMTYISTDIEKVKPFLRPMSSMTEEEKEEYKKEQINYEFGYFDTKYSIDWLNAHHFDYRGLIPMGLAIEATKDMYKEE